MMVPNVSRKAPQLRVDIDWDGEPPEGEAFAFISRVGGPEFAVYSALDILGGSYTFHFDDLLFAHKEGRYEARLVVGVTTYAVVEFSYLTNARILTVSNPNVRSRA